MFFVASILLFFVRFRPKEFNYYVISFTIGIVVIVAKFVNAGVEVEKCTNVLQNEFQKKKIFFFLIRKGKIYIKKENL